MENPSEKDLNFQIHIVKPTGSDSEVQRLRDVTGDLGPFPLWG